MQTKDIVHEFARHLTEARYESLPPAAIDAAKKSILDTFGCILAASGTERSARAVADVALECGGKPESSILGFGGEVPALWAAFAHGAMAHCLDFDDRTPWGAHAGSSLIPAAFALAQARGNVSGRTMITAIAAAQDIFVRLRCHVGWRQDWNLSTVLGSLSAAGAAAHVLGLTQKQTTHALGIASMASGGTMEMIYATGCDLRGLYAGFSAKGAVLAALMAQKDVSGIDSLFEGRAGIFNTYFGGRYERDSMLAGLGTDYLGAGMLYKPWPAVGISHTYIHASIELMKEHSLQADEIERIEVFIGDFQKEMSEPLEVRRAPTTSVDAKFSLPFLVALAVLRRGIGLADFTPAALKDSEVLAMAQRVYPVPDSSADWKDKSPIGRVRIVMRDGSSVDRRGESIPGSPEAPTGWSEIIAKFRGCAQVAAVPLAPERIDAAVALAQDFESLDDASSFVRNLAV